MFANITLSGFIKGSYNLIIHVDVDIDITTLNHFAATISSKNKILFEPFKFANDCDGFYLLLSKLVYRILSNWQFGLPIFLIALLSKPRRSHRYVAKRQWRLFSKDRNEV